MADTQTQPVASYLVLTVIETDWPEDVTAPDADQIAEEIRENGAAPIQNTNWRAQVMGATQLMWPMLRGDGNEAHIDKGGEGKTAEIVGRAIRQLLVAMGVTPTEDALLGSQATSGDYFLIGATAPNGTPLSISVNVTP